MKQDRNIILENNKSDKKADVGGTDILPYILDLCKYMNEHGIKIRPLPKINLSRDSAYKNDPMGKTAWYSPELNEITIITEGRHPKDVLRSVAHELVHHAQKLSGKMEGDNTTKLADPAYAQHDKGLQKLEVEAYLKGNMLFRAWEDQYK